MVPSMGSFSCTVGLLALLNAISTPSDAGIEVITLPGTAPIGMDYLAIDSTRGQLWVPAGNSERVDVIDLASRRLRSIERQPTATRGERTIGASSATIGDGVVFVGNRADSSVCGFDATTLAKQRCVTLAHSPDGLAWVPTTREVWVTTPHDHSLVVLTHDRATRALTVASTVKLEGSPEGYAVDATRGLFYTNLEDGDRTLVIDVRTKKVVATWKPDCGADGPRGLAIDVERRHLFVACTDRLKLLDATSGAVLSELQTGAGVDNIDLLPASHRVYVASGKEGRLTIAEATANGTLVTKTVKETVVGCRTVVVAAATGLAYLPDSRAGRIVVVQP